MSPVTQGIFIGSFSVIVAGLLGWVGRHLARQWNVPRRMDRIEAGHPFLLEGLALLLDINLVEIDCQQGKECNGSLTTALESINGFKDRLRKHMADMSVGQKKDGSS